MCCSFKSASTNLCCTGQCWQAYNHHCCTSRWPHCFCCVLPHSHRQVPSSETHWCWRSTQTYNCQGNPRILKHDIEDAAGPLQLCAGQDGGCEAAVHAMKQIFLDQGTEAALLVDATNAFNYINQHSAVHNINVMCPSLTHVLINTYRHPVHLFITGNGEIPSTEGTTQGAMAMYAIAIKPLITKLTESCPAVKKAWYADDATGASTCDNLRLWWKELTRLGPLFGYHPNLSKTYLVVMPEHKEKVPQAFADTGVQITTASYWSSNRLRKLHL